MKKEYQRSCFTKSLTVKVIPQFDEMATNIEDNLFYSAIKIMPLVFLMQQKKD
jgi:hypothetical protein